MSNHTVILNVSGALKQTDFSQVDTNYIIYGDYTLATGTINIPIGCVLNFQGGAITGIGTLTFNDTLLIGEVNCKTKLSGTIKNKEIRSSWFYNNNSEIDIAFLTSFAGVNRDKKMIVDNRIKVDAKQQDPFVVIMPLTIQAIPGGCISIAKKQELRIYGFEAGFYQCLEGEGYFRFLYTEAIYPQWFGECGKKDRDSSSALQQAFNSCRGSIDGSAYADCNSGCSKIYLSRGVYECANVDVYANCQVEGELAMATNGPMIAQIDRNLPALRIHCKNYDINNYAGNNCNGIGSFTKIIFRGTGTGSDAGYAPIIYFYSPQQSTDLFKYENDTPGSGAGFTDFNFENCWFQFSGYACLEVDATYLDIQLIDCTFDVVTKGVVYKGNSSGVVRCINTQFFQCMWGAITIDTPKVVCCYIRNSWFRGCGGPSNPVENNRYAIGILNTDGKDKIISIEDCIFEKQIVYNHQGEIVDYAYGSIIIHAESVTLKNNILRTMDNQFYYKFLALYSTNTVIVSNLFIIEPSTWYTHARIIGILSQETPSEKHSLIISQNIFNFTKKGEPFEYIIQTDYGLTSAVVTNNVTDDSTVPFIDNGIKLSGSIVTLNGNVSANVCHNTEGSLAQNKYKVGDVTLNTNPKYNIGWFCHQILNNTPQWAAFGAPIGLQNTTFGSSSKRPVLDQYKMQGFCYFDQTLNRPLWWTGINWVDSDGTIR